MDLQRNQRLRRLFDEAMLRDTSVRDSFLAEACADDPVLRSDVTRLIRAHDQVGSFLARPAAVVEGLVPVVEDFTGTERFGLVRRLGAGGMGVVYEVEDRQRGEIVALKTLRHLSGPGIYRLKQEFRRLADVSHPNVVCLYELVVEDLRGFFTMELVRGVNFVEHARPSPHRRLAVDRLTNALRQLLDGVAALHRHGKLHRDIKPSNVLVTPEGRTVILDFGLITELAPDGSSGVEIAAGTPAYVAPETAAGAPPSEAADWYGVGATLYEALTGVAAFRGSLMDTLVNKRLMDPPAPSSIADVPSDLNDICVGLMRRDPHARMSGAEALVRLGAGTPPAWRMRTAVERPSDVGFVGRRSQLEVLHGALGVVAGGGAASVCVYGPSGIGKSALMRAFVSRVKNDPSLVRLTGRCYEHESVPYKGLDGVVDSLSRYLRSLPDSEVQRLVPPDSAALARLFPVMTQVGAFELTTRGDDHLLQLPDPVAVRQKAFAALRALFQRLAEQRTVVVVIDDLQWADADSAILLDELLRPPDAPRMLTLIGFRSEEVESKPFLRRLLEPASRALWTSLPLAAMSEVEAGELIDAVVAHGPLSADHRARIAEEAGGNAFLLEQLAHYATQAARDEGWKPTFAGMFESRLQALSSGTRQWLEALAICGRPMAPELLSEATSLDDDTRSLVSMLRNAHLVRSSGSADLIEPYHDRIREALAASLPGDAVRRIHIRMAEVLVARGSDDAEALFEHFRGAGERERASLYAGRAAEKAISVLAFDRAATYYRHAIEAAPDASTVPQWKKGLATSLGNAGRPADAAEAFLDAARSAPPLERIELSRRGAEQFLIGGHIERGLEVIRTVLPAVGMTAPRTARMSVVSRAWNLARLRWRGLHFESRDARDIPAETLLRVDTSWSVMRGLAMVDMIAAADFSARHLRLALEAGEPARVARAMVVEGAWLRASDQRLLRAERDALRAWAAAARGYGPDLVALCELTEGLVGIAAGRWKDASFHCGRALAILRERSVDVAWELNTAQQFFFGALLYQGEIAEVSRQLPAVLAQARAGGNLFLETELCTRMNLVWLAPDRADEGERLISDSMTRWPQTAFYRQHHSALLARVQTALYRGDGEAAWRVLSDAWPEYRRAQLLRIKLLRIEAWYLRARSALAIAPLRPDTPRFLGIATHAARRLEAEKTLWSDALAALVGAGVARLEGRVPLATERLAEAVERFDRAGMKLYVAVARRRLAELQDGEVAADLGRRAEEWMAGQGIANVDAMTRMLAP